MANIQIGEGRTPSPDQQRKQAARQAMRGFDAAMTALTGRLGRLHGCAATRGAACDGHHPGAGFAVFDLAAVTLSSFVGCRVFGGGGSGIESKKIYLLYGAAISLFFLCSTHLSRRGQVLIPAFSSFAA